MGRSHGSPEDLVNPDDGGGEGQGHAGGPPGWGGPGGAGGPGGFQRTLHGQKVVSDGEGGFSTELTATGDVTAGRRGNGDCGDAGPIICR